MFQKICQVVENILSLLFEKRQNQRLANKTSFATFGQILFTSPEVLTWRYVEMVIVIAFCVPYGKMDFPMSDSYFSKDYSHQITFPKGFSLRAIRV